VSIVAPTALVLAGALVVAVLASALASGLAPWLTPRRGRAAEWAWMLVLAPLFIPPQLIGHAAPPAILVLKLTPVAVLAATRFPSRLSAAALHLYRKQARPGPAQLLLFRLRSAGPGLRLGAALVFLIACADLAVAQHQTRPSLFPLTTLLLPPAFVLYALWPRRSSALHLARQSAHPQLRWRLFTRPRILALGLLLVWASFKPIAAVLAALLLGACAVSALMTRGLN